MALTKTQKIMITVGLAGILASLIVPLISGLISGDSINTGKRVTCMTTVRNPVLTDNYRFERIECVSQPSLFCELPLSLGALSFFRREDTIKVEISAEGQLSKSKTVTIDEGIVSGTLKDVSLSYCVSKDKDSVRLRILDNNNQVTDDQEVSV